MNANNDPNPDLTNWLNNLPDNYPINNFLNDIMTFDWGELDHTRNVLIQRLSQINENEEQALFNTLEDRLHIVLITLRDFETSPTNQPTTKSEYGRGLKSTGTGNKWVQHVKAYASKHGMKYGEALKDPKCKSSYKK